MPRLAASPRPKSPIPHSITEPVTVTRRQSFVAQSAEESRTCSRAAGERRGPRNSLENQTRGHLILIVLRLKQKLCYHAQVGRVVFARLGEGDRIWREGYGAEPESHECCGVSLSCCPHAKNRRKNFYI
jgi:hypothetical protein